MNLSRTVSEINGDFSQKSQIFPPPVFNAPVERVSLGIEYRRKRSKTRKTGLPDGPKFFKDRPTFSRFDTIPECDSQPATQPPSHVAVAITLNAQASSLKTDVVKITRVKKQGTVDLATS